MYFSKLPNVFVEVIVNMWRWSGDPEKDNGWPDDGLAVKSGKTGRWYDDDDDGHDDGDGDGDGHTAPRGGHDHTRIQNVLASPVQLS